MRNWYSVNVGYSDHTLGMAACISAVALGTKLVEKHFTFSKLSNSFAVTLIFRFDCGEKPTKLYDLRKPSNVFFQRIFSVANFIKLHERSSNKIFKHHMCICVKTVVNKKIYLMCLKYSKLK
jgi:hypothetical protein